MPETSKVEQPRNWPGLGLYAVALGFLDVYGDVTVTGPELVSR